MNSRISSSLGYTAFVQTVRATLWQRSLLSYSKKNLSRKEDREREREREAVSETPDIHGWKASSKREQSLTTAVLQLILLKTELIISKAAYLHLLRRDKIQKLRQAFRYYRIRAPRFASDRLRIRRQGKIDSGRDFRWGWWCSQFFGQFTDYPLALKRIPLPRQS